MGHLEIWSKRLLKVIAAKDGSENEVTMIWVLVLLFATVQASQVRICVLEAHYSHCLQMEEDNPDTFKCVSAPDMSGCVQKVHLGIADITNVDNPGLYLGGKFYDLRPIITELVDGEPFRYQGIALVSKDSDIQSAADLENRTSCHTGLGRTVGWQIPVGRLYSSRLMQADCQNGDLASVANFFGGSCVPGPWSSDPTVEKELKSTYPKLCSRCKDPVACAKDDLYASYEGTMNCLSDGAADVAFTKIPALKEYLDLHPEFAEKAELLCFEGGRKSVTDPEPCIWGTRTTNAFVAKSGNSPAVNEDAGGWPPHSASNDADRLDKLATTLLDTYNRFAETEPKPEWFHTVLLSHPKVSGMKKTEESRNTYESYLGDFIHTISKERHGCEGVKEGSATLCVTSDVEKVKCEDYSHAAEARSLWPEVRCLKTGSKAECMETVKEDNAQLVVLDGGDVYKAGNEFGLQPIASELYNSSDATYYAVAVLRSASDVSKLADLKGLRSCHTGVGRTAGWVMPVGVLATEGLLASDDSCNYAEEMADFFSAGSCAPGANDTSSNPGRVRSEDLCRHCIGDINGQHKCARDSKERYSGYAGAFRCLAESGADVAFVKHSTVPDYTDGKSDLPWTKDLLSSDFMLLCDVGGTASVFKGDECNLGKVPSHQVVTGGELPHMRRVNMAKLLSDSSRLFSNESTLFRLFRPGQRYPDLLFQDDTTALKITPFDATYKEVLGPRFVEAVKRSDPERCA